jgi:hypothetical protein
MTTPAWVEPQLPEVAPAQQNQAASTWVALLGLAAVAALAFGLGAAAWNGEKEDPPGPQALAAVQQVDRAIGGIAASDWESAYDAFDQSCASFSLADFRSGFQPVFLSYRGHWLSPPRNEPFEFDQIVLVRGTIDLDGRSDNAIRAELRFAGATRDQAPQWRLCGLRIDES